MRHQDDVKVSGIMTRKLLTVRPEKNVRSAFFMMREHSVRHLLITDEEGKLVGIVSDRDLRRPDWVDEDIGVSHPYMLDEGMPVDALMTRNVVTVHTRDRVSKAVRRFHEGRFGALPVLDKNDDLVGIISLWDVLGVVDGIFGKREVQ